MLLCLCFSDFVLTFGLSSDALVLLGWMFPEFKNDNDVQQQITRLKESLIPALYKNPFIERPICTIGQVPMCKIA